VLTRYLPPLLLPSLAEFTDKLIARRGVKQSDLLFGGQIRPATKALSARTRPSVSAIKHPTFHCQQQRAGYGVWASTLPKGNALPWLWSSIVGPGADTAIFTSVGCSKLGRCCPTPNAALIAISPEAAPISADNASAAGSTFPVLIDSGGKIAEQFDLTFEMDDAAKKRVEGFRRQSR
jgi:hypothetical protein